MQDSNYWHDLCTKATAREALKIRKIFLYDLRFYYGFQPAQQKESFSVAWDNWSSLVLFDSFMKATVPYRVDQPNSIVICSSVKQGCVLAPTIFGIFFALLIHQNFSSSTEGRHLHARSDGKLFDVACLKAKLELLFANSSGLLSLQKLCNSFVLPCDKFGLTISLKKTLIMAQSWACCCIVTWTIYRRHERGLNTFHTCCLVWFQIQVPDTKVFEKAKLPSLIFIHYS